MRDLNQQNGQTFVVVTDDGYIGSCTDGIIRIRDG